MADGRQGTDVLKRVFGLFDHRVFPRKRERNGNSVGAVQAIPELMRVGEYSRDGVNHRVVEPRAAIFARDRRPSGSREIDGVWACLRCKWRFCKSQRFWLQ